MIEVGKENNNLGEHIDVKIGNEEKEKPLQNSNKTELEEMLILMKKQTEYMRQLKDIGLFFFWFLISVSVIVIGIFTLFRRY